MKILHLNTHPTGATFRTAASFHQYLLKQGHESIIVTARGSENQEDYIPLASSGLRGIGISRVAKKIFSSLCLASNSYYFYPDWNLDLFSAEKILSKIPFKPEVIILYWTKFFLTPKITFELSRLTDAAFFWFLMDMAPFTGGCNYSHGCEAYKKFCGNCPALKSKKPNDFSSKLLKRKQKFFQKINLGIIAPSTTLLKQASESSLFRDCKIYKGLLGIDQNQFKPGQKQIIREKMGLPKDTKVFFFGAQKLSDERKGFSYLKESLRKVAEQITQMQKERILLIYAGNTDNFDEDFPFQSQHLGLLDQEMLIQAYQSADVFLCPSVEDSGPAMINESLMCGTPVVSFDMGVAPDLVFNGVTGYRARLQDTEDFAFGIHYFLSKDRKDLDIISKNCRDIALEKSDIIKQHRILTDIITDQKERGV